MKDLARIVFVSVFVVFALASGNPTAEKSPFSGIASESQQYKTCNGKVDLRSKQYLDFDSSRTECEKSAYCSVPAAKIVSTTCRNGNLGGLEPQWSCGSTFAGLGYTVLNYNVQCSDSDYPCVQAVEVCKFYYTPTSVSQPVAVYGGVGGTLSFLVFCGIIYWCCCRRRRPPPAAPAPVIIRTVETRPAREPAPEPAPAKVSAAQTNVTVNFGAPPTAVYAAPAAVAPSFVVPSNPPTIYTLPPNPGMAPPAAHPYAAPAYAPPSSPPYNPNYSAPEPPKQGHYLG